MGRWYAVRFEKHEGNAVDLFLGVRARVEEALEAGFL